MEDILKFCDEYLRYDEIKGALFWKKSHGRCRKGSVAGCENAYHVKIRINKTLYQLHRIVWLMKYREFPEFEIDHIDHNRKNNRLENLRAVTHAENLQNMRLSKRNSSGVCGVSFYSKKNAWASRIRANGKAEWLGLFKNFNDAVAARKAAERLHGFHPNHGLEI